MPEAPHCEIQFTPDGESFVVFNGKRIAQRQLRGRGQRNDKWLSLEPGYAVVDNAEVTMIEVRYNGARAHYTRTRGAERDPNAGSTIIDVLVSTWPLD
jgi:hypothetical protein